MNLLYHASPTAGITLLEPHISNHGIPQVYFSRKRENVLVYLSNAIEKHCHETGFAYHGIWQKWGPYGFNEQGLVRIEEYYPDALRDTYQGVSGCLYCVEESPDMRELSGIKEAVVSSSAVPVRACEFIPDAYEEILKSDREGKIDLLRYEDRSPQQRAWIERQIREEYQAAGGHPEYRYFLEHKFHTIKF